MANSKKRSLSLSEQCDFWNQWNRDYREQQRLDPASERRAQFVLDSADKYSRQGPIIDIGCGTGWLSAQRSAFRFWRRHGYRSSERSLRTREELLEMLSAHFQIEETTTICPGGDMGILKLINERLTNYVAGKAIGKERLMKLKESLGLGQSYGFVVRKA